MAFTVQNDQGGVTGANAYIDAAFFKAYHTDRNVTSVIDGDFEDGAIQGAIVLATDFLDHRYSYVGERKQAEQETEWPRFDARDRDDWLRVGIPAVIKEACAELALAELQSASSLFPGVTFDPSGQGVKRKTEKLDVLEETTEYFGDTPGASARPPVFYQADWRLKRSGLLLSRRRIVRG